MQGIILDYELHSVVLFNLVSLTFSKNIYTLVNMSLNLGLFDVCSNAVLGCNIKNDRMISVCFQGKPFNITVIQVYAPTSNAEEAEVE